MFRIYSALIEILAAAVFILPVFAILGKILFHDLNRTVCYIVFGFYMTAVLSLTGFPSVTSLTPDFTINLIPFKDMASDFVNACLNVVLFIPFGVFLPILWDKFGNIKNLLAVELITVLIIEISQLFTFRTTDINDFLTNTLGTLEPLTASLLWNIVL